jgi:hypothetical protein
MNRLTRDSAAMSPPDCSAGDATWSPMARSVREPSLLRLAQSIDDLNPELALCLSGLAAMVDPEEREAWRARLAPWLDDRDDDDDGGDSAVLVAA